MCKPEEGERTSIGQPMRVRPSRREWVVRLEALFAQLDLEPLGEQNLELGLKLLLRVSATAGGARCRSASTPRWWARYSSLKESPVDLRESAAVWRPPITCGARHSLTIRCGGT